MLPRFPRYNQVALLRLASHRLVCPALLIAAALLVCSCAVPLGPGYTIQKQSLELHFVAKPQAHLEVRAVYRLVNSGNAALTRLELMLPAADSYHRIGTQAQLDGRTEELHADVPGNPASPGDRLSISFPEPWPQKQRRVLTIAYELSTGYRVAASLAVSEETFFASARSWAPILLPPGGTFAQSAAPPKRWDLSVRVPAGFFVHASGTSGRNRKDKEEWVYRFEQRPADFEAFAAGGRYREQRVRAHGETILFWTRRPLDEAAAREAGAAIAARLRYYEGEYGPRSKRQRSAWLIECVIQRQDFGCGQLPETVLVHPAWVERGVKDKDFLVDAKFELAYTWFGNLARVRFDVVPLPMDAAAPYAGWEAQALEDGPGARERRIRWLLADYDRRAKSCKEKIILPLPAEYGGCGYSLAWIKSGLFLFALEDQAGKGNLHQALRQMIQARRNRDFSLEDLIAALEQTSHQAIAEFVRHWLRHPGVPEEFRKRYQSEETQP